MKSLQDHLDHVMAERAGLGRRGSKAGFVSALGSNQALVDEAKKLKEYYDSQEAGVLLRDHVSREHARTLKEVLHG